MRNALSELGITNEADIEYFHQAMKNQKKRKELGNYIDNCILNQKDFSAEGFRHYLADKESF